MKGSNVMDRYIGALVATCSSEDVKDVLIRVRDTVKAWVKIPGLVTFFQMPTIPVSRKQHCVTELLGAESSRAVRAFFSLLVRHNCVRYVTTLAIRLDDTIDQLSHVKSVDVATMHEPDAVVKKQLVDVVERQWQGYAIKPSFYIDKMMLGGFKITMNNTIIDGSVDSNLMRLHGQF